MIGFDEPKHPLKEHQVSGAETLLGVTFPETYRELIAGYGGAYGDVEFDVECPSPGFETCGMGLLHSLDPCSRESIWSRMLAWDEHGLSPKLIPFGEDGGGNYICFDYRDSASPTIVFYFHEVAGEDEIMLVCSSFDRFLDKLKLPNDDA